METLRLTVHDSWGDRNHHMNEGKYGQVFSDAADVVLDRVGVGQDYIDTGHSYFTVEATIRFLKEIACGSEIIAVSQISAVDGKKLRLAHKLCDSDGNILATCTQLLIHVDLKTRLSSIPSPEMLERIAKHLG